MQAIGREGIDEAWSRLTAAEATAAGITFVIGYVSEDRSKNLTRAEIDAYHAVGIDVLLVYEFSATAVEGGAAEAHRNSGVAISQARALGYPAGCALGFAVDQDTTGNPSMVDAYARAFTGDCHAAGYRSFVYGGLATVRYCADHGLADLLWQTFAWSGTPTIWDARAAIRQVAVEVTIAGQEVDLDVAMATDIGAWLAPGNLQEDRMYVLVRRQGTDPVYLADGITRRWVKTPKELADIQYLGSTAAPLGPIFPLWNRGAIYDAANLDAFGVLIGPDPTTLDTPAIWEGAPDV
jgi:Domain of unknown function (DUF1906)